MHFPSKNTTSFLFPKWQVPSGVKALVTTRYGGYSSGEFLSFNLAQHVGDSIFDVNCNRQLLEQATTCRLAWLSQTHSTRVVAADINVEASADASWTYENKIGCVVLTADCMPVFFCNRSGTCVAAAHAGWRGLSQGILSKTIKALDCDPIEVIAWMGPAIGSENFEVGPEVREIFVDQCVRAKEFFSPSNRKNHFHADLYGLTRMCLLNLGVLSVYGGDFCTYADPRFFSYRKAAVTGRMASVIWLDES